MVLNRDNISCFDLRGLSIIDKPLFYGDFSMSDTPGIEKISHPTIDNTRCSYDETKDIKIYDCTLSDDMKYIEGYTEDGVKAKYIFDMRKWLYGNEISRLNLITFNQLDKEEHRRISSIGGTHTQDNYRTKRTLNDIAKQMLEVELTENSINEILGDSKQLIGEDRTAGAIMIAKMIQSAMSGSFKCAEFVRDTAGYKIDHHQVDINADIMTDSDRALLEKIEKRIG